MISSEELLKSKEDTLKSGINGIHKKFIRWLSLLLGIPIYGTIILCRVILFIVLIIVFVWFMGIGASF